MLYDSTLMEKKIEKKNFFFGSPRVLNADDTDRKGGQLPIKPL